MALTRQNRKNRIEANPHRFNRSAYSLKITTDIVIGKAKDREAFLLEFSGSNLISRPLLLGVLPSAVKFDDEFRLFAAEIGDILSNRLLPSEMLRPEAKILMPSFALPRSHGTTELLGQRDVALVIRTSLPQGTGNEVMFLYACFLPSVGFADRAGSSDRCNT